MERNNDPVVIDTPVIVVDLDQLEGNIRWMAEQILPHGVALRPHIKTHKTPQVAHMQLKAGATGITVAKLGEAELMAEAGIRDILIGNQLIGEEKWRRLARLASAITVRSCVDGWEGASLMSEFAIRHQVVFKVLLEVNTGLNRAGVDPDKAVELGVKIAGLPGLKLSGVFSFAGYSGPPLEEQRKRWALKEAQTAVQIAEELRNRGVEAEIVSVGGSSSAPFAARVPGVTEVRPGTYVFNDVNYARLGIMPIEACAMRIAARIISRPADNRAVIDAGSKVLSGEKRTNAADFPGHGYIPTLPGTIIESLWEEHGVLRLDEAGRQLRVGDVIEIVPNHVCTAMNLADRWFGRRDGVIQGVYPITLRGKTC